MHRTLAGMALLLALAGCARPKYREPDPRPVQVPVRPPERILRVPPEFTFQDYATGKQYYYRAYKDAELEQEIVTVVGPGDSTERDASPEERDYALKVLVEDWTSKSLEQALERHRRMLEISRLRRDSRLDTKIELAQKAVAHLEEELFALQADKDSSTKTPGYQPPPGRLEFLERRLAEVKLSLYEEKARYDILVWSRATRDRDLLRSTHVPAK